MCFEGNLFLTTETDENSGEGQGNLRRGYGSKDLPMDGA
jgi:hypothetical protein